jgi:2-polyprenyl-3-methyl-5-hydroxy-6-metoxy-1,4-benzoquinol methylase
MQDSDIVHSTLARPDVHARWIGDFYGTEASHRFHETALDHITSLLEPYGKSQVLDAGCGDGVHAIRLAQRGYPVLALDFSEHILEKARANIGANKLSDQVEFRLGDLLNLPFADNSYDSVLCWGVLMHIPDVEKALSELARIVRPKGLLVISENNCWSVEAVLARIARRVVQGVGAGKNMARLHMGPSGAEYWRQTESGPLICREVRVPWLVNEVTERGFILKERIAGEFIERHANIRVDFLRRCVQEFNLFWFKYVRLPQPAVGNFLVFEKRG